MSLYGEEHPIKKIEKSLNYVEIIAYIEKELEQFGWLPLSTSFDGEVNSITAKFVSIGLELYFILLEDSVWVKQINKNSNVALTYMSRQIKGTATVLGDPFLPKFSHIVEKHKIRHRDYIEAIKNISVMSLVKVDISSITIFQITKGSILDWTPIHLDLSNKSITKSNVWHHSSMISKG